MMNHIDVMKQALEAARDVCKYLDAGMVEEAKTHTEFYWDALDKIRDMDEAEKVEPVAWMNKDGWIGLYKQGDATIPLYTAPPQREWVGLTDEEIDAKTDFRATVRYFEAKLKEKNNG
jgi:hypothetical protein